MKIFLSSTSRDLSQTRAKISQWLSGIFGVELIVMETFGSDDAPPDINSVRRVRECDLFVGIYAHRYGTVDKATGESITELELDEAKIALSSGVLGHLLLYCIDDDAPWPDEYRESGKQAQQGLRRLKTKVAQHTYTRFNTKDELTFYILRDVYRILSERFGTLPLKVRESLLPTPRSIRQPVGMEFLTSENRDYLIGRETEVGKLIARISGDPITVLLGDSGIGKTSLIHAGLIPRVKESGWRAIYARPLGLPCTDIVRQIQTTIFEGRPTYKGPLVSLLAEVAAALREEKALLIIDQFEDVLGGRDYREVEQLISELRSIRELAAPCLRVLISYRADLEGRLGEYWQQMSGSPRGLPRVYLRGINDDQAWEGIKKIAQDLSINMNLREYEQLRIKRDLLVASQSGGFFAVYPPYIQMLIDHMWSTSKKGAGAYRLKDYQEAGGMEGVIGGYLNRQLEYAQDSEGYVQAVLVSLVRSYGVKAQRPIDEIVADTGFEKANCEAALEKLIDLRLVRHIEDYYEISHDFIARRIMFELVDSEVRELKRFQELLTSKAAAFETTKAPLTCEELLMLYKHKERVVPSEVELRLLLSSWVKGRGPALYWLLNAEAVKILEWLRADESKEDIERDEKVSIVLLRKKLGETPLIDEDYLSFRSYRLSAEMAGLILENPLSVPRELLFYGLRHRRREVQEACRYTVAQQVKSGDWSWIEPLRKSNSIARRQAYEELVLRDDVGIPEERTDGNRALEEFAILKKIALSRDSSDARKLFKMLQKGRVPRRSLLFGKSLVYLRERRLESLLREVERTSTSTAELLLSTIDKRITLSDFAAMLCAYKVWNLKEKDRYETPAVHSKARALAAAILRSMGNKYLPRLREVVKSIRITPSSRDIVLALLKYGSLRDLRFVLHRVETAEYKIDFWNHTELGRMAAKQMAEKSRGIPKFLLDIMASKEFWEYIPREERKSFAKKDLLSIWDLTNRALYVRLAGYAMIGTANESNEKQLLEIAQHYYGLVARAAAIRLVQLLGDRALRGLGTMADESIRSGRSESLADAIRSAEVEFFGLASLW